MTQSFVDIVFGKRPPPPPPQIKIAGVYWGGRWLCPPILSEVTQTSHLSSMLCIFHLKSINTL